MRLRHSLVAAVLCVAFTSPCFAQKTKDYTILKVGPESIRYSDVLDIWTTLFPSETPPDFATFDDSVKQNVLRGMVSERLLYQEAVKQGFDKNAEVQKRLQNLQKQIIIQSFIEAQTKALVSEASLKKAYEEKAAQMKNEEEIRARHILVEGEAEAKRLYEQLQKGGDFAKLAKEKSIDKGSSAKGGDLDFFTKDKMVPEFSDAAFKLKNGEISQPIKSEFGWHIIKVEDRRKAKVPSFADMKDALQSEVQQKGIQSYVDGLVKGADIHYFDASGKELPFDKTQAGNPSAPHEVP